ncbi:MAG: PTS sugar transporter subunit IIA [Spirochaetia bacterium]|nr:PTS sugar transporter subunit IIA [Spirochaetia bacterium]
MELFELIPPDRIKVVDGTFPNKEEFLRFLLDSCCEKSGLTAVEEDIWTTLLEREQSMSTGIGLGVAIPHCSTDQVNDCLIQLVVLKQGIDFASVDDEPVRIAVLILMPKDKFERHIKTLAAIARLFNDASFRNKVLASETPEEIHALLKAGVPAKPPT